MRAAYESGDCYLTFAKQAGAVPESATKESHPIERESFKSTALAVIFGMEWQSLALRLGQSQPWHAIIWRPTIQLTVCFGNGATPRSTAQC
jgi:hypothetical protein